MGLAEGGGISRRPVGLLLGRPQQHCGCLFPCRLIREQLLEGDFTVNMRLLQVMGTGGQALPLHPVPAIVAGWLQKQQIVWVQGPDSWTTSGLDLN